MEWQRRFELDDSIEEHEAMTAFGKAMEAGELDEQIATVDAQLGAADQIAVMVLAGWMLTILIVTNDGEPYFRIEADRSTMNVWTEERTIGRAVQSLLRKVNQASFDAHE